MTTGDALARLRAGLDADEAIARAIDDKQMDSGWSLSYNQYGLANTPPGWYIRPHIGLLYEQEGAEHVVRFNPARVLRQVGAMRKVIDAYEGLSPGDDHEVRAYETVLSALAEVYDEGCPHPQIELDDYWTATEGIVTFRYRCETCGTTVLLNRTSRDEPTADEIREAFED